MKTMSFKELSDKGLIYKINRDILHPLGLALSYDPKTGISTGALIASDGVWRYSEASIKANEEKLKKFEKK